METTLCDKSRLLHSKSTEIIKNEWLGVEKHAEQVKIHISINFARVPNILQTAIS